MADPTLYTVSYSFSGFQANSPTTPLPAPKVDAEFANIAAAVATLVTGVTDIRRADGALKNGLVTFESLTLAVQLMLDPSNATLVANAVAAAQASATAAGVSQTAAAGSAASALANAIAAAASAATVNLSLYLAKANNLAGLGSLPTSRANLGLGTAAVLDVGALALNIVQLDGSAKLPAYDGSQLINIDTLPVGTTIWTNATAAPTGFVKENGALISRASFPRLYAFANASGNIVSEATWSGGSSGAFSTGDLTTTFRLPDARGEFIRGYDDGRGIDAARVIGAHQADSLKDHTHSYSVPVYTAGQMGGGGTPGSSGPTGATTGSPSTGAAGETRSRNNAKLACIKF